MARLWKRQREVLDDFYNATGITSVEDMDIETWDRLVAIRDYKNLYDDCNSYLNDIHINSVCEGT